MKPYFKSFPNPHARPGTFDHFEVQTVQQYDDLCGGTYYEPYTDERDERVDAIGDVEFGVFGRTDGKEVEHITDCSTLEYALNLLRKLGVPISDDGVCQPAVDPGHGANARMNTAEIGYWSGRFHNPGEVGLCDAIIYAADRLASIECSVPGEFWEGDHAADWELTCSQIAQYIWTCATAPTRKEIEDYIATGEWL